MKKPFIVGNWKMNLSLKDAVKLAGEIKSFAGNMVNTHIGICPPAVFLSDIFKVITGSNVILGAQNIHFEDNGAFTGEISGLMIKDVGCTHTILGHSERRHVFGETDEFINKKLKKCFVDDISPIFCVGETLDERENGKTNDVIEGQLQNGLKDTNTADAKKLTIAYEPVWAIGTGKTASPEQANEVHAFIRDFLSKKYDANIASDIIIQYGGSVKPDNIRDLLMQNDIDGALVGGASLKSDSFLEMIEIANSI